MRKIQVMVVHGGNTFKTEKDYLKYLKTRSVKPGKRVRWHGDYLEKSLGSAYEVFGPRFPLQDNAKYRDWKITFERYLPLLHKDFILIGSSLGGIFLAKFLSENTLKRKPLSVYLVCPPFDSDMPGDDLAGGFRLGSDLSRIPKNTKNLHLLFSKDDNIVPVSHAEKYRKKLPGTEIIIYKSKNGHFLIEKFPEIVKMIKGDVKNFKNKK